MQNALFVAASLTENADVEIWKYSGYGIAFYRTSSFSFPGVGNGQNVIIWRYGVDINSSIHIDNKGKDVLILGKGPTEGLGEHSLTAEKCIWLILA